MTAPPRCRVCISNLLPDGTCRYKCPPELKRSAVRHEQVQARKRAKQAEREARAPRISEKEVQTMSKAVAGFDPVAAYVRRRSQTAQRNRRRR